MIWADRVGVGLGLFAALLEWFFYVHGDLIPSAGIHTVLIGLFWLLAYFVVPAWLVLRVLDFIFTGRIR